jgi:hypothetical protein
MLCPNPQPGQDSSPAWCSKHKLACVLSGCIKASSNKAVIHIKASKLSRIKRIVIGKIEYTGFTFTNQRNKKISWVAKSKP